MLKILSLFSGIGAFEKALENIDEPFELVNYCEIDKYASKAFSLIHGVDEGLNLGDITAIDTHNLPNDIDVITYGFPCQDISNAGKQKGFTDENGERTRSGLFFEALRIIEDTKPKFAIAENVKALTGKRFTAEFKIVLDSLNDAGYKNYWAVLNAKDYGIPQNRERVFIISIRNDINHGFNFPKPYELKLKLKDVLETNVDEKYFLTDEQVKSFMTSTYNQEKNRLQTNDVCATLCARDYKSPKLIQIGNCKPTKTRANLNQGRVYDTNGISPTLNCCGGGNLQPYVCVREATKKGYAEAKEGDFVNLQFPNSKTRRGRVGKEISQTSLCNDANGVVERLRIRKLTPKECFRLMGFDDRDVDVLIENKISNTQLYKMAGNSIVVDVLEEIFVELLNQYSGVI